MSTLCIPECRKMWECNCKVTISSLPHCKIRIVAKVVTNNEF